MRVVDYKVTCLLSILIRSIKFNALEKRLKRCSSFIEQKDTLRNFYKDSIFKRDDLLARQHTLLNKKSVGLKEIIFIYKDILIAIVVSLLTLYLENKYDSNNISEDLFFNPWFFILVLVAIIALTYLMALREKVKFIQKEIPLQEIFALELRIVERALALEKEEIDYDQLFKPQWCCAKVRRVKYRCFKFYRKK